MRFKRFFILLLVIVSVVSSSFAHREWSAENVPIPYLKDSTQYVSDPDGYLSKEQKDSANFYLQKLNLECGVQNVLVIVGQIRMHSVCHRISVKSMVLVTRKLEGDLSW